MKKLQAMKKQLLNALIMLAISIPLLLIALSLGEDPTLAFEGLRMEMQSDGSVQVLVEVSIQNVENSGALPVGARFRLNYNPEYMVPSSYDKNAKYEKNEKLDIGEDAFLAFDYSPELYQVFRDLDGDGTKETWVPEDPFEKGKGRASNQILEEKIVMELVARRSNIEPDSRGITLERASSYGSDTMGVFDQREKITLGTLSFRIEPENVDKLPEITKNFNFGDEKKEDPHGLVDTSKYLIWHEIKKAISYTQGSWSIIVGVNTDKKVVNQQTVYIYTQGYLDNSDVAAANSNVAGAPYKPYAKSHFAFKIPTLVIGVEAVEPELTVDAYQAYTTGHISDLDIVLQKYSPAVLVRYSDGTQENVIFPWGRNISPWSASKVMDWDNTTNVITDTNYDCTKGDYKVQKLYCYTDPDDPTGNTVKEFPLPVSVHLTVTPITLVDVTAKDLYRVYPLNNALVSEGVGGVRSLSDLDLPDIARLITDVPAGGATLTMTIPGWSHTNVAGDGTNDPVYWPFTNMTLDPPSINMGDLWKDGATAATGDYLHWPTGEDRDKWETTENGVSLGANRAGDYTFVMAQGYGKEPVKGFQRADIKAAYPWLTVPNCTKVPDDPESWPLENALRRIVWEGSEDDKKIVDKNLYQVSHRSTKTDKTIEPELFLPELTLRVTKAGSGGGSYSSLPETTLYRVKLPDGTQVGTYTYTLTADVNIGDWFDAVNGDSGRYTQERVPISVAGADPYHVYDLKFNPGVTDVGDHDAQRERLLRYINLGGWFSVSINEDPETYYWSDDIPVYVPPRENVHLEDKIYNFVGENADLYHFVNVGAGMIPTTVTLPAGSYKTVDAVGDPEYIYEYDNETHELISQTRREERYGVKTLYSGVTGSQFGELNTFSIEPEAWSKTAESNGITRYGKNEFKHEAHYGAYNYVYNTGLGLVWEPPAGGGDPEPNYKDKEQGRELYTATIRTQSELLEPEKPEDPEELKEKIKLVYEGPVGGVTPHDPTIPIANRPNVELVTFDTQVQGYTVRQEYTLTIVNVGDVDINGLSIDMLTDKLYDLDEDGNPVPDNKYWKEGGNFTLLKPPASFLPAGEKTTFTLSYVYDLKADGGRELEYLDKLFITSDKKHTVEAGATAGEDYLLDFDAKFKVSGSKIHHVWVEYNPADGCMGTAQVIVGNLDGVMDTTAGSNAAIAGMTVYVMATPTDEYKVRDGGYTAVDSNGTPVTLTSWSGDLTLPDGTTIHIDENSQIRIWSFTMPDYDTTVTIDFYEPISSKLRLSDLKAYASKTSTYLYDDDAKEPLSVEDRKPFRYDVWQKSFTDEEKTKAAAIRPDVNDPNRAPTEEEQGLYLMQYGTVTRKDYDESVNQYLVVVPYEADYSQIEAILREVPYTLDGANPNLPIEGVNDNLEVRMTWFPEEAGPKVNPAVTPFNYPLTDYNQIYRGTGKTGVPPTVHTSRAFDSPTPGYSSYVRIRINYENQDTNENVSRFYFVEIHRMPKEPIAELNYGNSPYGMIMNATNIADADKAAAKKAFVNNKYSFDGLPDNLVPKAVKEADENAEHDKFTPVNAFTAFSKLHYWTEAWVAPDAAYEPESGMGLELYDAKNNLDLSDVSFFAIIGEDFLDPGLANVLDSTGRPGRIDDAVLSLEVYTLDTAATTQTERFALPDIDPSSRIVTLRRNTPAGSLVKNWSSLANTQGKYLRPGRYQLIYTLPDFDYDDYMATPEEERDPEHDPTLKVVRDFVVLAPVGDVNADMPSGTATAKDFVADDTDHKLVKGRIIEPLGYMAKNYRDGAIFKLRTCDVNNDRNINNIDANTIRVDKCVERYYLPIDYKEDIPASR